MGLKKKEDCMDRVELEYLEERLPEYLKEKIQKQEFSFLEELPQGYLTALHTQIEHIESIRSISEQVAEVSTHTQSKITKSVEMAIVGKFTQQCLRRLGIEEYSGGYSIGVSTAVLYTLYELWCEINGITIIIPKTFTNQIRKLGYRKDKGKCLVKSFAYDEPADKQQIVFHNVPGIADTRLIGQVKHMIQKKLTAKEWSPLSKEYQLLHALEVWFEEKNNVEVMDNCNEERINEDIE